MTKLPNINPNEEAVLTFLASAYGDEEANYFPFGPVCSATKLDRSVVRLACRSLARKGLTRFGKGLWRNDGEEPGGSGYCCTDKGKALADCLDAFRAGEAA